MKKIYILSAILLVNLFSIKNIYSAPFEYIKNYSTSTWSGTKVINGNLEMYASTPSVTTNFEIKGGSITKVASINSSGDIQCNSLYNSNLYVNSIMPNNGATAITFTDVTDRLIVGRFGSPIKAGINIVNGSLYMGSSPVIRITSNGEIRATAGTTATPALSFAGDTDTGFSNINGNDQIQVVTGGAVFGTFTATDFQVGTNKIDGYDISDQFYRVALSTTFVYDQVRSTYSYLYQEIKSTFNYLNDYKLGISSAAQTYVYKTGDTMTGSLSVPLVNASSITASNIYVNGITSSTYFYGDGYNLTNLPGLACVKKNSDQSTNSTTGVDITDLSFPMEANTTYGFYYVLICTSSVEGNGINFAVNGTSPPIYVAVTISGWTSATAIAFESIVGYNVFTNFENSGASKKQIYTITGVVSNGDTSGTFTPRVASEGATESVTVFAGSWGYYTKK